MDSSRITSAFVKAVLILIVAGALYFLWTERASRVNPGGQEEQGIGPTDVAVEVGAIQRVAMRGYVTVFGTVQPAPASTDQPAADANVSVATAALVDHVLCYEGQHVDRGQALFTLDARALDANIQHLKEVWTNYSDNYDRLLDASKKETVPVQYLSRAQQQRDVALSDLNAALAQKKLLSYASPIAGTVVNLRVSAGAVADPTVAAVEVVDLDRLIVEVSIPSADLASVQAGRTASVLVPGNPTSTTRPTSFESSVLRVDRALDSRTNMGTADISVPAAALVWPGQWAQAQIVCQQKPDCLAVPAQSIVRDSLDRAYVGLVSEDGRRATLEPVQTGLHDGDLVEVRSADLREGQTIVTSGSAGLLVRTDIRILKSQ